MGLRATLLAVHAHPDDEAIFTGGILARYAAQGVRTVLVTCTGGEFGFGPSGTAPGSSGRDEDAVRARRRVELEESCAILGVEHLELLGYRDSGMAGWPQNAEPGAFCAVPVPAVAERLAALFERYRPDVVVTYGADGFYGHPDHIQAHRATMAALEICGVGPRVFGVTMTQATLRGFREIGREMGVEVPEWVGEALGTSAGGGDSFVVDCTGEVDAKYSAICAHRSQLDNAVFMTMGVERFGGIFRTEAYLPLTFEGQDSENPGSACPGTDLFEGMGTAS